MQNWIRIIIYGSVKFIFCYTLICFTVLTSAAQEMMVRIYNEIDGLPGNYMYGATEDKLGYMWVGSPDGLSRYDGKTFTNYGIADGLPDSRCTGIFVDNKSRYWAVTPKGPVQFIGNKFISYPFSDSQKIRGCSQILQINNDKLLLLTTLGVYQFNVNKWDKIKLYPGYENQFCRTIVETNEGLYINYGNLLVLKKTTGEYIIIGPYQSPGYYYNLLSFSAGRMFISTLDGIYEVRNYQLIKAPGAAAKISGIYAYLYDSKKRFWIAIPGLGIRMLTENDTNHLKTVYAGLSNFLPQSINEDKAGNIWVGSGNGLIKISETNFTIYTNAEIFGRNVLRNVFQPPNNPLWINNGTMKLHSFENGILSSKKLLLKSKTALPNNELIIDRHAFDDKGRYWYALRGFALVMQEGNNIYEQSEKFSHLGDEVFDVVFDNWRKKIIIAVGNQKFPCIQNDTSFSIFPVRNNQEIKGDIRILHQCLNGTILFTTSRGYVYSIDKQNKCKLQLNEFKSEATISYLYNDPNGDVWLLYSGRGLRRYRWQNDSLFFINDLTKKNGLPGDNCSSLCFDNKNNLWVCNNSGVTVFSNKMENSKTHSYKIMGVFNARDLQINASYDNRLTKDKNGNIWFFSDRNLRCFYPDKLDINPVVPAIQIENIELNLRQTNWSAYADSLSGIFQLPFNLKLSHDYNTIGIYFKGISSSGTDGIKYSYQFNGLDDLWSTPAANDFVSFIKLPPGKYIFRVKAQLPNTNWSTPAEFSFEIKKAFWQTWWFYLLTLVSISAIIYFVFRYRLQQKIKLLEIRNRFSRDLHDEIGSSISGINLLSQIAAEKLHDNQTEEASEYLFKVKNYTQDVMEKLSDMVWIFNPQNDSIEKLVQRLKSFSISIALSKNINMHFETFKETDKINLTIRQRKVIYLVSKEAINNCFKYAACANIYFRLTPHGSKWQLQIQDDGIGFATNENLNGNGLKNMQARVLEIGGTITIQSKHGEGTIITLHF